MIRIKYSLHNPNKAQTITMILSSTKTEKPSHTHTHTHTKKIPYQNRRYLQQTPTQQQSNNPNWRIAKQELTRRPQSK